MCACDSDCVEITETWLNNVIPDSLIVDLVDIVFRKDICTRGRGVRLILKNNPKLSYALVSIPPKAECRSAN
jgi:hypothetical protein